MKRSEYSQLRATAEKRISRLKEAGFDSPVAHFPTLKELSGADFKSAAKQLTKFMSSKLSTIRGAREQARAQALREYQRAEREERRAARMEQRQQEQLEGRRLLGMNPKELTSEQRQIRRRYQQRIAKREERARGYAEREGWTKNEKALYKAAQTLGLKLSPKDVKAFADYVSVRHSMAQESAQYAIDKYAEDFDTLMQKGLSPQQIADDFKAYQKQLAETRQDAEDLKNAVSEEDISNFIKRLLSEDE